MSATLDTPVPHHDREAAVLGLTLYAEAGTRPVRALEGLAALVMNRVAAALPHWGVGIEQVCRAPFQFACWNPRHPRHALLRNAGDAVDPALAICRRIALRAVAGALPDLTGGATHYHGDDVQPGWAVARLPLAEIGGLLFYRLEPVPVPRTATRLTLAVGR